MPRPIVFAVAVTLAVVACRTSSGEPYNPYAVAPAVLPPVAPDGTIQWGTFFKSAQLDIIQAAGTLFSITGNKGHGCTLIQQLYSGDNLFLGDCNLFSKLLIDFIHSAFSILKTTKPNSLEPGQIKKIWDLTRCGSCLRRQP